MTETEILQTRTILLKHIKNNPGIRYRELLRLTGFINGVLTYHLAALERIRIIKAGRQTRITRYYPISISQNESTILQFVKQESTRKIILFLLDRDIHLMK